MRTEPAGFREFVVARSPALLRTASNFPIAMLALTCAMVGTGITALREQMLPRWLCWASIALGVMAPLGELAFAPFVLFPVWTVVVAGTIHLSARDTVLAADGADR